MTILHPLIAMIMMIVVVVVVVIVNSYERRLFCVCVCMKGVVNEGT